MLQQSERVAELTATFVDWERVFSETQSAAK